MLSAARARAKKVGVPFSITREHITIPEYCPILGIKLERGPVQERHNSPSLDRVRPELGYIPGNVAVISYLANRIKSTGTADEHRRIADWMDAQKVPNVIDPDLIELGKELGQRIIDNLNREIEERVTA